MKNMKKLLGAMAALGFTTVAAVNVVACNPGSKDEANDLTKSFNKSYTQYVEAAGLKALGLEVKDASTFTFDFSNITEAAIKNIIKPSGTDAPVKKSITIADPTKIKPDPLENDEIAQVVKKTEKSDLVAAGDKKTVSYVVTLKLFKAIKQSDDSFKYVDQNKAMDVTVNIDTALAANNLSNVKKISDITSLNVSAGDLSRVSKAELIASKNLKDAIQSTLTNFATGTTPSEYTFDVAKDKAGATYEALDLKTVKTTFVQITATADAKKIEANSKTGWIEVNLPAANSLSQIDDKVFNTLAAANFEVVDATAVKKGEIVDGIKKNGALLAALKAINSKISAIENDNIVWKIASSAVADDMGSHTVSASGDAGVTVYITLTPGSQALFSGTTAVLAVQIPKLENKSS